MFMIWLSQGVPDSLKGEIGHQRLECTNLFLEVGHF